VEGIVNPSNKLECGRARTRNFSRINLLAVPPDLEVQMRAGRSAAVPHPSDRLSRLNLVAGLHIHRGQMRVPRLESIPVADDHGGPVPGLIPGKRDLPSGGRRNNWYQLLN